MLTRGSLLPECSEGEFVIMAKVSGPQLERGRDTDGLEVVKEGYDRPMKQSG